MKTAFKMRWDSSHNNKCRIHTVRQKFSNQRINNLSLDKNHKYASMEISAKGLIVIFPTLVDHNNRTKCLL